jgi:hypothetical protein
MTETIVRPPRFRIWHAACDPRHVVVTVTQIANNRGEA